MVKMIHALTGTLMYVDKARQTEYLAAGHKLAAAPSPAPAKSDEPPAAPASAEPQAAKSKTAATKKR